MPCIHASASWGPAPAVKAARSTPTKPRLRARAPMDSSGEAVADNGNPIEFPLSTDFMRTIFAALLFPMVACTGEKEAPLPKPSASTAAPDPAAELGPYC